MLGHQSARPHPSNLTRLAVLATAAFIVASIFGVLAGGAAAGTAKAPHVHWKVGGQTAVSGVVKGRACKVVVSSAQSLRRVTFTATSTSGAKIRARGRRDSAKSFTCSIDTRQLPDGPAEVTATATAGNGSSTSASQEIVVDNGPPRPTETSAGRPGEKPTTKPTEGTGASAGAGTPPPGTGTSSSGAGSTTSGGSVPGAGASGWFAPSSVWNRSFSGESSLAPKSAGYVSELVRQVNSAGPWINTSEYSTPVYTVPAGQPTVAVKIVRDDHGWVDPNLQGAFNSVPIPAGAKPAAGSDKHMVVWQPSADKMWEFWEMRFENGGWVAGHGGAMEHVSTNPGYYDKTAWSGAQTYWGATATALPLVGGLMTAKELSERRIPHALAMALPEPSPSFVWPAQRSDGWNRGANAIPEGTIFRLPANLNLQSLKLSPVTLAIATAAQRYGIVVRDTSGCVCLYGEDPSSSGADYSQLFENQYPNNLLKQFPWGKLVAVAPGS